MKAIVDTTQFTLRAALNLANGSTAIGMTIARGVGATCGSAVGGVTVCSGAFFMDGAASGITFGNAIFTGTTLRRAPGDVLFLNHESVHSTQYALFGPILFGSIWTLSGGPVCGNLLEEFAGSTVGYKAMGCSWA